MTSGIIEIVESEILNEYITLLYESPDAIYLKHIASLTFSGIASLIFVFSYNWANH